MKKMMATRKIMMQWEGGGGLILKFSSVLGVVTHNIYIYIYISAENHRKKYGSTKLTLIFQLKFTFAVS